MPTTIAYPWVNGYKYDFSSIQMVISTIGVPVAAIKSIEYSSQKQVGDVWGTSAQRLGRTRGQLKFTGSVTIYKQEWSAIATTLAIAKVGLMDTPFDVTVTYADQGIAAVTDILTSCLITGMSDSYSNGSEPLSVKIDLDIMDVTYNGLKMLSQSQNLKLNALNVP